MNKIGNRHSSLLDTMTKLAEKKPEVESKVAQNFLDEALKRPVQRDIREVFGDDTRSCRARSTSRTVPAPGRWPVLATARKASRWAIVRQE